VSYVLSYRPIRWYHSLADLIWPVGPFNALTEGQFETYDEPALKKLCCCMVTLASMRITEYRYMYRYWRRECVMMYTGWGSTRIAPHSGTIWRI
jgi:hypothetical protein